MKFISILPAFFFLISCVGLSAQNRAAHVAGDLLIQLQPGSNPKSLARDFQDFNGQQIGLTPVREISAPLRIWLFQYRFENLEENKLLLAVKSHTDVAQAQFNHIIETRETTPDDPLFSEQWQWVNTGASGGTMDADVDADLAWDITTGGNTADGDTIVVCVVDDGTDLNHPDLAPNHWINFAEIPDDNIDNDENGYIDDYLGWNINSANDNVGNGSHGVEVNGMIGATGNNANGGTGMNWRVKIMTVRRGSSNEADAIEAYTYPLVMRQRYNASFGEEGAFVVAVNSSWGTNYGQPSEAPLWCAFYDTLGSYGILSCASTANLNINVDTEGDLPTACPSDYLLSVTASDNQDQRNFSAFGPVHVDVAAPGENIVTTATGGGYTTTSGTSFASPLTAGIVALLYSAPCSELITLAKNDPPAAAALVKNYILEGVDPVESLDGFVLTGGRVNAFNSLQLLMDNCGPCPPPHALNLFDISGESMTISWINPENSVSAQLRWRQVGSNIWNLLENVSSPYILDGLSTCTAYEFQVVATCTDNLVTESNIIAHYTDGCCDNPDIFQVSMVTQNSVTCYWSSVLAAYSYDIRISVNGSGNWTDVSIPGDIPELFYTFSALNPCTEYSLQIRTICENFATDWKEILFTTEGCGFCIEGDYCASAGESQQFEYISHVNINMLENFSEEDGYGNFTQFTTNLIKGNTYQMFLAPGFTQNDYPENFRVWIDYNQDGEFSEGDELAWNAGLSNMSFSGNITIPTDAVSGDTRMRVSMKYIGSFNPPQIPCEEIGFGEVEDYCVEILPPNGCAGPVMTDTIVVTQQTAVIQWSGPSGTPGYTLRYRAASPGEWIYRYNVQSPFELQDLEACTRYVFQLQAVCGTDSSGYAPGIEFSTDCIDGTTESTVTENKVYIYPNPCQDRIHLAIQATFQGKINYTLATITGITMSQGQILVNDGVKNEATLLFPAAATAGVYILYLETPSGKIGYKVVRME